MSNRGLALGLVVCAFFFAPLQAIAETNSSGGTIVVARSGEQSLILWDVTPLIASIVANKTPRDEALHNLEAQAIGIAESKAASLANAKTITIRILYERTGDVSPVYKTATFAGVERVVSVTIAKVDLAEHASAYAKSLAAGSVPLGVTLDKTGDLPTL